MTSELINIEMGALAGLEPSINHGGVVLLEPNSKHNPFNCHVYHRVPDFTKSRDELMPIVEMWCGDDAGRRASFMNALHLVSGRRNGTPTNSANQPVVSDYWKFVSTPIEICEALLIAAGKWTKK